jgi:integrase
VVPSRNKTRHPGIYYRDWPNGRRYIVWYSDADGKGRTETLPLGAKLEDAVNLRASLTTRKARGELVSASIETIEELADRYLEEMGHRLRPKTLETYRWAIDQHIKPKLGRKRAAKLSVEDVAWFVRQLERDGKKAWSIRACLTPLSRMLALIGRRGASNPVLGLDKDERPKADQKTLRVLTTDEITRLIESTSTPRYRLFVTMAIFTGLRRGELISLRWGDIDFASGLVEVRASKTDAGVRKVVLMPTLSKQLREHRIASPHSQEGDYVFAAETGNAPDARSIRRRGFEAACERAGIEISFHELRHTFASILIGQGEDATYVSDQMGHSSPAVTYRVYAKLFDPARRRDESRARLEEAFGGVMGGK